jgi:ribosomal protein S18 acetylase RimI-like enzyme
MLPAVTLRSATPADATQLSEFARRNFAETFGPANSPEDLALHLAHTYAPELQRRELGNPRFTTVLAEVEGKLAGYAQLRDVTPPASVTTTKPIELLRFYVERTWHGHGVAGILMEAVLRAAQARGAESIWLCVWQQNPRAIAFYTRQGFVSVGTQTFVLGTDPQLDWVMARPL